MADVTRKQRQHNQRQKVNTCFANTSILGDIASWPNNNLQPSRNGGVQIPYVYKTGVLFQMTLMAVSSTLAEVRFLGRRLSSRLSLYQRFSMMLISGLLAGHNMEWIPFLTLYSDTTRALCMGALLSWNMNSPVGKCLQITGQAKDVY